MNGFDTSLLFASFWSLSYVYISTIFAIMTTQIISKVFSAASFLIMTNYMRQLPRFMFWCLFPQCLHCQSFNAGLRASCLWLFQVSEPKEKSNLHQIEFRRVFFGNICFTWKCVTKIPSCGANNMLANPIVTFDNWYPTGMGAGEPLFLGDRWPSHIDSIFSLLSFSGCLFPIF